MSAVRSRMCVCRRGAVSWRSRPSWWWAERSRSRSARSPPRATASSPTRSPARSRACAFDLGDGDIVIVGGGRRDGVEVQRSERSSFGHDAGDRAPRARRRLRREVALPDVAARARAASRYRVVVPDNVAVDVRTTGGDVTLPRLSRHARGWRPTAARSRSPATAATRSTPAPARGDIAFDADCAPPRLSLRSNTGTIRALIPPGQLRPRRREQRRRRARARRDRDLRRAVQRPGPQHLRRRLRGGPLVIGALELDGRFTRAGHAIAYLFVTLPVTVLALPAVLALILGAALSVAGIGLPLLRAAAAACRGLERLDRRAANRWLAAQVPPIPAPVLGTGGGFRRSLDLLSDRSLWRTAAHLTMRPGARRRAAGRRAGARCSRSRSASSSASAGSRARPSSTTSGRGRSAPRSGSCCSRSPLPAAALALAALETLYRVLCVTTHALLTPRMAPGGPVREMLAESLGDRTVNVVYWLPDRERFVDEAGQPVELPEPGSGRAWTAVDRDGRRVAAIVHDAALDATPGAGHGRRRGRFAGARQRAPEGRPAGAGGGAAGVAAADHGGRRRRAAPDRAQPARRRAAAARRARAGAAGAAGAAARTRRSTTCPSGWPRRWPSCASWPAASTRRSSPTAGWRRRSARWPTAARCRSRPTSPSTSGCPAPVEAAAYFLVAEALTNVARYAEATSARVEVRREDDELVVLVADDGVGGVDPSAGGGLRGLEDRVATVGGTLDIDSPIGGGTRLRARIPVPS